MSKTLDNIIEAFPEESFLTADGFDNCIIGLEAMSMRLIYSKSKIIMQLVSEGLTLEEAFEHFSFNISVRMCSVLFAVKGFLIYLRLIFTIAHG